MAAPISYVTLDYIIPSFAIANPALLAFTSAAPYLAPFVSLLLGVVAVVAALRSALVTASWGDVSQAGVSRIRERNQGGR